MTQSGRKFDSGKPMLSLLPPHAVMAVGRVLTIGAQKYAVDNWKFVPNGEQRYKDALMRHLFQYLQGTDTDEETGEHHLAHLMCCALFILDSYESGVPLKSGKIPESTALREPPAKRADNFILDKQYTPYNVSYNITTES